MRKIPAGAISSEIVQQNLEGLRKGVENAVAKTNLIKAQLAEAEGAEEAARTLFLDSRLDLARRHWASKDCGVCCPCFDPVQLADLSPYYITYFNQFGQRKEDYYALACSKCRSSIWSDTSKRACWATTGVFINAKDQLAIQRDGREVVICARTHFWNRISRRQARDWGLPLLEDEKIPHLTEESTLEFLTTAR